jgi:hypothetical protein
VLKIRQTYVKNKNITGVKNKSDNETSVETNDSISLFIDICYIFIGNECSCLFQ